MSVPPSQELTLERATTPGDFDGDGRTDLLRPTDTSAWEVHLSTGTDFSLASSFSVSGDYYPAIADFNGDGLDDVFLRNEATSSTSYVYLSKGNGSFVQVYSTSGLQSLYVGEWNGDGRADIAHHNAGGTLLFDTSTGDVSSGSSLFDYLTSKSWSNSSDARLYSGDWNGDGVADLWNRQDTTDTVYKSTNGGFDLVDRITDGLGAVSDIAYAPLTDAAVYTKGSLESYPKVAIQNTRRVVKNLTVDDGDGGQRTTEYEYEHAVADLERRAGFGFGKIVATDLRTDIQTVTEYDQQAFPYIGMPTRTERRYVGATPAVLLEENDYTLGSTSSGGVYFPYVASVVTRNYELDGSLVSKSQTSATYDTFGNPTSTAVDLFETEVQVTPPFSTVTTKSYHNDTANWYVGQLICQTIQSSAAGETTRTRTSGFEYGAGGLVTKEVLEPDSSATIAEAAGPDCVTAAASELNITLVTTYGYDAFGNRTSITIDDIDAGTPARTTAVAYGELNGGTTITDTNGRFPVRITNAKGHVSYNQYDARFGEIMRTRDANGAETQIYLDGFGRPETIIPDGGARSDLYRAWCSPQTCPDGGSLKVLTLTDGAPASAVMSDFLGREVTRSQLGFDGQAILVSTEYDNHGRLHRASRPYFHGDPTHWTTFGYDALARVTSETAPGETGSVVTTFSYSPLEVLTTNDAGQQQPKQRRIR